MSGELQEQAVSRRGFLRGAAAAAVAATATGVGAAVLVNQNQAPVALATPIPAIPIIDTAQNIVAAHNDAAELLARLAAAQAENLRLQAQLDGANRQLETVQAANSDAGTMSQSLSQELANATGQMSILTGLVALYEQLEQINVGDVVENGLTAVSSSLTALLDKNPALSESIEAGQLALAEIETHLPTLENGRQWLDDHLSQVASFYSSVETLLAQAVATIGPFLEMLNSWFADIRKWLPFGLGERASEVMQAISVLLGETPKTIDGVQKNVSQPLAAWVGPAGEEAPLKRNLIRPLRERVLAQASESIAQAQRVQTTYQTQLAEPTQTAVTNQKAIRNQIVQYREQHQI